MRSVGRSAGVAAAAALMLVFILGGAAVPRALAASCGGTTQCQCGDTVISNYTMTSDLGPCPRIPTGDTVGLRLTPGVTLDCQGHAIAGPGDLGTNAFGIRVGSASTPVPDNHLTIRNCWVTGFWWGIYVQNARNVLIEGNHLYANGWKEPVENGSGYGLDVANSTDVTVRDNAIFDNGNEGFHLSGSSGVTVEGNRLSDNGLEQLYLIRSDGNVIRNNYTEGGSQGLEMRYSNNNTFSYNVWAQSPAQVLENDNSNNVFFYDSFEGRVVVGDASLGNRFELCAFDNPTGTCLRVNALQGTHVYKGYFQACALDVVATTGVTLERSINNLVTVSKSVTVKYPGCSADFDLDGIVGPNDRAVILAALNSVIGGANWNPEADLDHNGAVDAADLAIYDAQFGPCIANLVVTVVSDPPATAVPASSFLVTDTVQNQSRYAAGSSRTLYYLSLDPLKSAGDILLGGGRTLPGLVPHGVSTGTVSVLIPSTTPVGTYFLLACADAAGLVAESDDTDNCRAAGGTLRVGRPDLVVTAVSDPPPTAIPGSNFLVTDTVRNQSDFVAGASWVQYYLSLDGVKSGEDRLLVGSRPVPGPLPPNTPSSGTILVVIPTTTPIGTYYLLACTDNTAWVIESNDANNCRASGGTVQVGRPDLVVTALSDPVPAAVPGTTFTVRDTVRNQSLFVASASLVRYYLSLDGVKNIGDRLLVGGRLVSLLAPNGVSSGSAVVGIPANTPVGTYFLLGCADDPAAVIESNDANNCRAAGAIQVGRPDLVTTALSNPPPTARRGTTFSVTDTVTNQSIFPSGPSWMRYYLSLDGLKNTGDRLLAGGRLVPNLPPNTPSTGTVVVGIPTTTPAGTYVLLGCADDTFAVVESDETNNCRAAGQVVVGP